MNCSQFATITLYNYSIAPNRLKEIMDFWNIQLCKERFDPWNRAMGYGI